MNHSLNLLKVLKEQKHVKSFRNFHLVQVLNQRKALKYADNYDCDTSLFFTNLPSKRRERRVKTNIDITPTGDPIIECKNKKLNHYVSRQYGKFEEVPLASKSWSSKKSKGDHFTILPRKKYSPFNGTEELPDTFEKCEICPELIKNLKDMNMEYPTAIQSRALEKLLGGDNVFIFSECGSGKTVAYLLAMAQNILKWKDRVTDNVNSPLGIIILPSRELALQVLRLAECICEGLGIECKALLSGSSGNVLLKSDMSNVDILICNIVPLCRVLAHNLYSVKNCKHVVVDDIQFFEENDMFKLVEKFFIHNKINYSGLNSPNVTPNSAQICFVSATVPSTLEEKFSSLIQGHTLETISSPHLHKVLFTVPQKFLRLRKVDRPFKLLETVKSCVKNNIQTLIFSNRIATSRWIVEFLKENEVECVEITKTQKPRDRRNRFTEFQSGAVKIASSTNIMSTGVHLPQLRHILNYDFPLLMTDYIYRCGRVGRLNQTEGCYITNFVCGKREVPIVQKIEKAARTDGVLPSIYCYRKLNNDIY